MTESKGQVLPIVGIGASAGGLEALRELFKGCGDKPGIAFVVVQHLDPNHDSLMAQLLERFTEMTVTQAAGGEMIEGDHVYVIPPGHGLAIEDGTLRLTEFTDPRGLRRPIDDFFESLANERGNKAGCVILSGTGGDGSRGLRAIKEFGGLAVVQEPSTARYDGMPVSAIATGLVDIVLPPAQVIEALRNFFDRADSIALDEAHEAADHVDEMCTALREAVGHDFSGYKRSTLSRRIARRMQVIDVSTSDEYLARLKADAGECQALFRDLLINVTRFFRDREEFEKLESLVIDPMVAASRDAHELRIWVAGCSSGEEAYTIAMLVSDAMRRHERHPYVQIFATDIDEKMLEIARGATYPLAALPDIPTEYQSHYIDIGMEHFTIAPRVRDMVRFSSHNLVRDPPYSKIDLLCCRNLLIYFDEDLQREVMPAFHFALAEQGKMFLGSSESIGRFEDLFTTLDQRARLFERRDTPTRYPLKFSAQPAKSRRLRQPAAKIEDRPRSLDLAALTKLAERHAPVSMLVDAEGILLNQWGAVSRYLSFPDRNDGQINVLRQVKPGLGELLGPLLRETVRDNVPKIARNIQAETDFGLLPMNVMIDPIGSGAFLIVFRETGALAVRGPDDYQEYERGDGEMQFLQEELQSARLRLRTTVEELETANEELKSSNEEMMSMNEELQSTNEELTTVNDELKAKVDQVTTAHSDLKNFFDSTELVVLVVDANLNLRSSTDAADTLFSVGPGHVGLPLATLPTTLTDRKYVSLAADAARAGHVGEYRTSSDDGSQQYVARVLPYRLLDGSLAGATLVFTDVTQALKLETALTEERARLRMALDVARIGIWEYEPSTGRTTLDEMERGLMGIASEPEGEFMDPILARLPSEDRDRVNSALRRAMDGTHAYDETFRVMLDDGSVRWLHGLGRKVTVGDTDKFIGVSYDVTAEREQLVQRELMLREMNHRVKNLFAVITALTKMSARHADDVDRFALELCDRIHALGRSHAMTVDVTNGSAELRLLLEAALKPASGRQKITLDGPDVHIANSAITPVGMILHEWATNSTKYGALSVDEGRLVVEWSTNDAGRIAIDWRETGGGTSSVEGTGFGVQLIEASARQISGKATGQSVEGGYQRTLELSAAD
ncbi:CheR family methyltransferase [Allopontixanthobacter confluentis]|nr:CheR family methyltransferase [Allopontixanthobacter confluentis]